MRLLRLAALVLVVLPTVSCASGPRFQGMSADDIFAEGRRAFEEEDWSDAAETLDHLLLTQPGFERAAEARMMLARAYFNDEKYLTAEAEFTRFLERHPGHPDAARAALGICRSYEGLSPIPERDQSDTERAAQICRNVAQDWAGVDDEVAQRAAGIADAMRSKLAHSTFLNADFYFDRELWDSAIIYYELVVERFGDTDWAPRAIARIIDAYEEVGYQDEVEEWRERLLNSYPDSPQAKAIINGPEEVGPAPG